MGRDGFWIAVALIVLLLWVTALVSNCTARSEVTPTPDLHGEPSPTATAEAVTIPTGKFVISTGLIYDEVRFYEHTVGWNNCVTAVYVGRSVSITCDWGD